jgi:hypothetical protein
MISFKQKAIKKYKKLVDSATQDYAEISTNYVLQKDLINKHNVLKHKIKDNFDYYLDNYVLINEYLYNDFSVEKAIFNNEETDIKKELELKQQVKKILKQKLPIKISVLDRFNKNKQIKKWWILSTILKNYIDAILLLQQYSTETEKYKEIHFNYEKELYSYNMDLIQDFSFMEK